MPGGSEEGTRWTQTGAGDGEEQEFDRALRPRRLAEFIGQQQVCANLDIATRAARQRGEPLDHLLFCGSPGLGKTTLAFLIATEMDTEVVVTSGPALAGPKDLAGTLTRLERGDVLFIDEVHRLPRAVEEYLYTAMEDHAIDIALDPGPSGRTLRMNIAPFTLVAATTREGLLAAPFRSRFGIIERLLPYPDDDLFQILKRAAGLLNFPTDDEAAAEIARRSRGTPRVALRLQRRLRDLAQVRGAAHLDHSTAIEGLDQLGVDVLGLEQIDRELLIAMIERGGEPVGLKTLAAAVAEAEDTLESVIEPYLLRIGFLNRTPRGRQPTEKAYRHLGRTPPTLALRQSCQQGQIDFGEQR
ncbi:MAG: Holliday junction branch migration DNA helicase RuvB [Planctomycetes bacterium]|jgi:Holliday junction DNA helicase RuvB|nr:Holliday junction branch migration DNA helicase RuvB [Planctomycetota bacterium]MDP6424440.1 Holliday junction branch migration DNA helicase RuvB [Planctomycetota bacterium]